MKILKKASGNKVKLSKREWEAIGKKAGWMKSAKDSDDFVSYYDDQFIPYVYLTEEQKIKAQEIAGKYGTPLKDLPKCSFSVIDGVVQEDYSDPNILSRGLSF